MKHTVLKLMTTTGVFAPFRLANRGRALILTYHRFSENGEGGTTSARVFEEQIKYLKTHYQIVPLSVLADHLTSNKPLPPRMVALTIDDGYRDAHDIAFPILKKYSAPATLFVVTDFLDRLTWMWTDKMRYLTSRLEANEIETDIADQSLRLKLGDAASRLDAATRLNDALKTLSDELKDAEIARLSSSLSLDLPDMPPEEFAPLTWDEAREMDGEGVSIESHTLSHPILPQVSDERLRRELVDSRARVEDALGREATLFCYPNGGYDERVLCEVKRAGYRCAVTTEYGMNDREEDLLALRRITADTDLPHFIQSTSGFEHARIKLRGAKLDYRGRVVHE